MFRSLTPRTIRLRRRLAATLAVAAAAVLPLAQAAPHAQADDSASAAAASGYWMVASDGGIFSFGTAKFFGSTGNIKLNQPIVGIAATPTGNGYWMVATDGGIFSFGDAKFFGSTGNIKLNKPIVGMASTPSGNGYWMVASDGGIFSFGDAKFFGSTGAIKLNKPITAMAATPSGQGYWLTASDGGIFSYGDGGFFGAAPSRPAQGDRTVAAMVPSPDGAGYWQASTSGEVLAFGSAADLGGVSHLSRPIVGMTAIRGATGAPAGGGPGGGTTDTTAPSGITTTTLPPVGGPQPFSSAAASTSWRTPDDPLRTSPTQYAQLITAVAYYNNRIFVAGEFTNLLDPNGVPANPPMQYLAELDAVTGAPIQGSTWTANAQPDKPVLSLAVSPDGKRLYAGGEFNNIGGQRIDRLAALDIVTGKLDPGFNPPTPTAHVNVILPANGRVYFGGAWKATPGTPVQPELGALNEDGTPDTTFVAPQDFGGAYVTHGGSRDEAAVNLAIQALAVTGDGNTLMVGGNFLHLGKAPGDTTYDYQNHGGLVALDAHSGAPLTTWQPMSTRPVFGMATGVDGKSIFVAAGGGGGDVIRYLPGDTGKKPGTAIWKKTVDGDATAVAVTATRVYLVGHYDHVCQDASLTPNTGGTGFNCHLNGPVHRHLAAFDLNGVIDPGFDAQANTPEGPDAVAVGPHALYVGGNFTGVADRAGTPPRSQNGFALYPGA